MGNDGIQLKIAGAIALALCGFLFYRADHPSFAADGIDPAWDRNVERSRAAGRPVVLLFTANWCPYCVKLHEDVLPRDEVERELSHYSFYTVDLSNPTPQQAEHARKYGASGIPLLIRFDANGNQTARANFMEADALAQWLKAGE